MKTCPKCNRQNKANAHFCQKCGISLLDITRSTTRLDSAISDRTVSDVMGRGALLQDRRYEITAMLEQTAQYNIYQARDRQRHKCPSCGQLFTRNQHKFCEECGNPLTDAIVILWEATDAALLAPQARLVGLSHPNLHKVYETFEEPPSKIRPASFYAVLESIPATSLSRMTAPQPARQVLGWIKQLVAGLTYLHSQGYHYPALAAEQILLTDGGLKLTGLEQLVRGSQTDQIVGPDIQIGLQYFKHLLKAKSGSPAMTALFEDINNQRYNTAEALLADIDRAFLLADSGGIGSETARLYWQTGRLTDVGMERQINEDSLLTLELAQVYESASQPLALFAVADGMGGHETGEVASHLAIHTLGSTLLEEIMYPAFQPSPQRLDYKAQLEEACAKANLAIYNAAQQRRNNMGTTLVSALLVGSELYVANVGDSRAYLMDKAGLRQITEDHTYVKLLMDKQQLSPQQAQNHPQANLIYRTLGDKPRVTVDVFREQLRDESWLLLCSDGLTGLVTDDTISHVIKSCKNPQNACEKLVKKANDAGGHDNITVIIVKITNS